MSEIIPAIMPDDYHDLVSKLDRVDDFSKTVQIDVMDGIYVPSESWPYNGSDLDEFEKIIKQEKGLPSWEKVNFIIDLMVSDVESKVYDWILAGASGVVLHFESLHNQVHPGLIIKLKEEFADVLEVGIAVKSTTPFELFSPFLEYVDFVQCMGIEKVGYQGQDFDENIIDKIKEIRNYSNTLPIVVDGAVNNKTIHSLLEAGATKLVVGSALFESEDMKETYEKLSKLV